MLAMRMSKIRPRVQPRAVLGVRISDAPAVLAAAPKPSASQVPRSQRRGDSCRWAARLIGAHARERRVPPRAQGRRRVGERIHAVQLAAQQRRAADRAQGGRHL